MTSPTRGAGRCDHPIRPVARAFWLILAHVDDRSRYTLALSLYRGDAPFHFILVIHVLTHFKTYNAHIVARNKQR
jgi:hypothetical protein